MNHHYRDIVDRLGPPLWWDEEAVPRYCSFSPNETANIYASEAVLLEIACQNCGQLFKVAMSWDVMLGALRGVPSLESRVQDGTIHFGDPPNSGCCPAGATMNSIPRRVLEFWKKGRALDDWTRMPALEREVLPEWADEAGGEG